MQKYKIEAEWLMKWRALKMEECWKLYEPKPYIFVQQPSDTKQQKQKLYSVDTVSVRPLLLYNVDVYLLFLTIIIIFAS